MSEKYIVPCLYLKNGKCVAGFGQNEEFNDGDAVKLARFYSDNGADELLVFDLSDGDEEHEEAIGKIREICKAAEIPVIGAGNVKRMEDIKKLIYAGCAKVVLNFSKASNRDLLEEVSKRFGKEKMVPCISTPEEYTVCKEEIETYAGEILVQSSLEDHLSELTAMPLLLFTEKTEKEDLAKVLEADSVTGITGPYASSPESDIFAFKSFCEEKGIPVKVNKSALKWSDFKLNSDGMIPVVVQDYKTDEVLMVAYMNEEAFNMTVKTGKMTYYSRSRQELWVKGMTSGHFQYMKSLTIDCDNDTILAKVDQIGAACHTGNRSCFFTPLIEKEYDDTNPLRVFQNVYDVILDRKENPKEGSYTNYLFDKGIDKILKKVGEECTEIVIAAKNPDPEEIKYEISDFLYHVMVLMAEKGVTWEDITEELARR